MATEFDSAVAQFVSRCLYVITANELATKWRLELMGGYTLDLYFNATLGKYSYTLVRRGERIVGWDNAPHHPGHHNFPHHCHRFGRIEPSPLTGDPSHDLEKIRQVVESLLQSSGWKN